jgi:PAS domain S-box-containing protein
MPGRALSVVVAVGLILAFLALAGLAAALAYRDAYASAITRVEEDLAEKGAARGQLLHDWRVERFLDAWAASGSPAFREDALQLLGHGRATSTTTYAQAWTSVTDDLAMLRSKGGYAAAMILAEDGRLIYASDADAAEIAPATREAVAEVIARGEPVLSAPWVSPRDGVTHLDVTAPIAGDDGVVHGAAVLRVDPTQVLYEAVLGSDTSDPQTHISVYDPTADGILEITPDLPQPGASLPPQLRIDPSTSAFGAMILAVTQGVVERPTANAGPPPAPGVPPPPRLYEGEADTGPGRTIHAAAQPVGDSEWVVVTERDAAAVRSAATDAGIEAVGRTGIVLLAVSLGVAGLLLIRQRRLLHRLTRAESERAVATQRLDDVLAHGRDVVFLVDATGRILDASPPAVTAYGLSVEALRTRTLADLRGPEERWSVERDLLRAQAAGGARWESVHVRGDGTLFPVEVIAHAVRDGDLVRIEIVVHDVTGRRAAERTVQQQIDELRRWQAGAIGREERILELKAEVNDLLAADGRPPRYASVEQLTRVGHDG